MQLHKHPECHLTYCTNIHPGETWPDILSQLKKNLPELKSRLSYSDRFGVGLRLSDVASKELLKPQNLELFKQWLEWEGLYVFTLNGFPFGSFHGQRVKDQVYLPDWRTQERLAYTSNLVAILAELLPEGVDGGISTSPLSYKYWMQGEEDVEEVFKIGSCQLARIAFEMANIREVQGKELHIDIEPEPDCILENSTETIAFFTNWLFPVGSEFLSEECGISLSEARTILQYHIRVCYDTCHFAVEFEEPELAIRKILDAGIRIGKTQISAALKVRLGLKEERQRLASRLETFDEPTYLHQVVERHADGSLFQYRDLGDALPHIYKPEAEEWRIHFHVPVFLDQFRENRKDIQTYGESNPGTATAENGSAFSSTQGDIVKSVRFLMQYSDCRHYEIETYTWEVLPDELKTDILESIEREFKWVLGLMN